MSNQTESQRLRDAADAAWEAADAAAWEAEWVAREAAAWVAAREARVAARVADAAYAARKAEGEK